MGELPTPLTLDTHAFTAEILVSASAGTAKQGLPSRCFQEFHKRMSPEEWQIAERRKQGQNWRQIAGELGGTAESRRKQLTRAVNRVAGELGLDEVAHE